MNGVSTGGTSLPAATFRVSTPRIVPETLPSDVVTAAVAPRSFPSSAGRLGSPEISTPKLARRFARGSLLAYDTPSMVPPERSSTTIDLRMSLTCSVLNRSAIVASPSTFPPRWNDPTPERYSVIRRISSESFFPARTSDSPAPG